MKKKNRWQKNLYNEFSAKMDLDSEERRASALRLSRFFAKHFNLAEPINILDVPCGTGRYSHLFARQGHRVVGVDINPICLKIAKAKKFQKNLRFIEGDMSKLGWAQGKFDLLFNLYSSFGYFATDRENEKVLRGFVRCLKPGGSVVIQVFLRPWAKKFLSSFWIEDKNYVWQSVTEFDKKTKYRSAKEIVIEKKSMRAYPNFYRIRVYDLAEMKKLMRKCGLRRIKVFDGFTGKPYAPRSPYAIFIGSL